MKNTKNSSALLAAKKRFWKRFGSRKDVEGVGISEDHLRVYVRNAKAASGLPKKLDDIWLEPVITGKIVAAEEDK